MSRLMTLRDRERKHEENHPSTPTPPVEDEPRSSTTTYRKGKHTRAKYDGRGCLKSNGKDVCDCLTETCPGCWNKCRKCGSTKCGPECRVHRRYYYNQVDVEGTDLLITNDSVD